MKINHKLLKKAIRQSNKKPPKGYINSLTLICENIAQQFGIELNTTEQIALSCYFNRGMKAYYEGFYAGGSELYWDVQDQFMKDYFGLDIFTLTDDIPKLRNLGSKFIRTPEFKQYCRDNIQRWRDERGML